MANPDADTDKVVFDAVTKTMKKAKGAYSCITMVNHDGLLRGVADPNGIRRSSSVSARRRPTRRRTSGASPPRTPRSTPRFPAACATSTRARRFSSPPTGRWSRDSASTPNSPRASSSTFISLAPTPPSTPSACTSSSSRSAAASRSASRRANGRSTSSSPCRTGSRPLRHRDRRQLELPYREGLVKNRYVGRTFIMPDQRTRELSVRRKLNAMRSVFNGKKVLLVDDSIVRGTTMSQIVQMCRAAGATKVYLASAAPR